MDFLRKLLKKQRFSKEQVVLKAYAAKHAYDKKDFPKAAIYFKEYFEMKGYGQFPKLDLTDFRMYLNLMISEFYALNYSSCIKTCDILINLESNASDAYAFSAMSYYKLEKKDTAVKLWELAKQKGNQIASIYENIEDVKMQGFNN